jgi:hypothetical protein
MNRKNLSSFENVISQLSKAKNLGLRIRFVLHRGTVGMFSLDGTVEEISSKAFRFRGEGCIALIDWESCALNDVEDMSGVPSEFSFNWRFVLDGQDFFIVAGLEPFPAEQGTLVN